MPIRLAQVYLTTTILVDGDFRQRAENRRPNGGAAHRDVCGNAWAHSNPVRPKEPVLTG